MFIRVALLLLIAAGVGGLGLVAWLNLRQPPPVHEVAALPAQHFFLVAAQPLRAGSLLKPEDLDQRPITLDQMPAGAIEATPQARSALFGAMVRRSLAPGEPIRPQDVMHPGDHGFLAAVLAPGMRAVTIDYTSVSSSVNLIWPGDHVDMVLTQDNQIQTATTAKRVFGETVLTDIRVLAIDQQIIQGASATENVQAGPRTITVEVTPEQAERLAAALRLGKLAFDVRSAEAPSASAEIAPPKQTIWAGDVSPALAHQTPPTAGATVHVWQGGSDAKEFHF